jgi:hypothetical protein
LNFKRRFGLRPRIAGLTVIAAAVAVAVVLVPGAFGGGVTGAAFTTVNTTYDGGDFCKNGTGYVNCNIYEGKQYVWLNGGPSTAYVGDGDYFFAVVAPGGQHDPLDGGASNLSDTTLAPYTLTGTNSDGSTRPSGDLYTNRTFHVTGGVIDNVYGSTHILDSNKLNLMPYDDTTNNGGVYILAICSLKDGYAAVTPSNCKYDAFKVAPGNTTTPDAAAPTVTKDAAGAYDTTYTWDSAKSVAAPTTVNVASGSATFHYTITATHSAGTDSNIGVSGAIQVFNNNADDIIVHVSDALSNSTACTIKDGTTTVGTNDDVTVPNPSKSLTYSCPPLSSVPTTALTNTVTVKWDEQLLNDGSHLAANTTGITHTTGTISFTQNKIDECTTLTDTFDGSATTLGVACVGDSPAFAKDGGNALTPWAYIYASGTRTFTFTYDRTVAAPSHGCVTKNNTASFSTNDNSLHDPTTGDNSASVTVCRVPPNTGALTIGFWQNKNGQAIITSGAATSGVCNSGTWLRQYAPFQDLSATANCAGVGTYVGNIIKAANASGAAMNAMLKAQMLATALDVYFSNPALGGNRINAPVPIGGIVIDLTQICKMIDGSGGTATCSGTYQDASAAFGGAQSLTVLQILAYAASQSNAGGSTWYGQVKATQELAKNTFDAINNKVALSF